MHLNFEKPVPDAEGGPKPERRMGRICYSKYKTNALISGALSGPRATDFGKGVALQ